MWQLWFVCATSKFSESLRQQMHLNESLKIKEIINFPFLSGDHDETTWEKELRMYVLIFQDKELWNPKCHISKHGIIPLLKILVIATQFHRKSDSKSKIFETININIALILITYLKCNMYEHNCIISKGIVYI